MAIEWGMVDKSPFDQMKNGRKRTLRVKEKNRELFLTQEEADKLQQLYTERGTLSCNR